MLREKEQERPRIYDRSRVRETVRMGDFKSETERETEQEKEKPNLHTTKLGIVTTLGLGNPPMLDPNVTSFRFV